MLHCGFYERCVTPPIGSEMPGYWRTRPSSGVLDELYIKAFVTDDGQTQTALIVVDAVSLSNEQCDTILKRVEEMSGIPADRASVSCNHTHYGVPCGDPPGTGALPDLAFMDVMCRVAADCVFLALQRLQPCQMTFGVGHVEGIAYCRDYVVDNGDVCTNPGSAISVVRPYSDVDPELPVLFVKNSEGKPMGALVCYALHQDSVGGSEFTGDFSSELSRCMKKKYGADFICIFTAGTCGDINHVDRIGGKKLHYTERGQILAKEAIRVIEEASVPVSGDRVDGRRIDLHCRNRRATPEQKRRAQEIVTTGIKDPLAMLGTTLSKLLLQYEAEMDVSGQTEEIVPVQVSMVGDTFVVALPGEPYHAFGRAIKQGCPTGKCIITTLSNADCAYIPTPELLNSSIYPAQLCAGSRLEGDTGDRLVAAALAAMDELLKTPEHA